MEKVTDGLTQGQHLFNHYTRLIEATKEEIVGLRARNAHFNEVDEALTYLTCLRRSRAPYETNGKTAEHLKILSS